MLLAIDLSERAVAVILANAEGRSEIALRAELPRVGGVNAAWLCAMETARAAMLQSHVVATQIENAAVAFYAPLGSDNLVRKDARAGAWANFDLDRALKEHLGIARCRVETRAVCAALAEQKYGALRESENWLYLHLGESIAAAAAASGVLQSGASRAALELGAICIERGGELGSSGRRGALDAYCGREAFMARARSYGLTFQSPREIWEGLETNAMAKTLCDDFSERLAQGVGAACALLNPARLVFGGEMFGEVFEATGEKFLAAFQSRLPNYCAPVHWNDLEILAGQLGGDAAVLGALALAVENKD